MNTLKEIYFINFKAQLISFNAVSFAIYTFLPTSCQHLKKLWKSAFVNALKRSFAAASISAVMSKRFPLIVNLISGNSQKSESAKSGKYGG
jgi:hypothetical protein